MYDNTPPIISTYTKEAVVYPGPQQLVGPTGQDDGRTPCWFVDLGSVWVWLSCTCPLSVSTALLYNRGPACHPTGLDSRQSKATFSPPGPPWPVHPSSIAKTKAYFSVLLPPLLVLCLNFFKKTGNPLHSINFLFLQVVSH